MGIEKTSREQVLFTVPEFARLIGRTEEHVKNQIREGKIKGYQTRERSAWRIPESELAKWWGNRYGKPRPGKTDT
jgi:excisionase family DNA binding protein